MPTLLPRGRVKNKPTRPHTRNAHNHRNRGGHRERVRRQPTRIRGMETLRPRVCTHTRGREKARNHRMLRKHSPTGRQPASLPRTLRRTTQGVRRRHPDRTPTTTLLLRLRKGTERKGHQQSKRNRRQRRSKRKKKRDPRQGQHGPNNTHHPTRRQQH